MKFRVKSLSYLQGKISSEKSYNLMNVAQPIEMDR